LVENVTLRSQRPPERTFKQQLVVRASAAHCRQPETSDYPRTFRSLVSGLKGSASTSLAYVLSLKLLYCDDSVKGDAVVRWSRRSTNFRINISNSKTGQYWRIQCRQETLDYWLAACFCRGNSFVRTIETESPLPFRHIPKPRALKFIATSTF
jgi:hypothetical protein